MSELVDAVGTRGFSDVVDGGADGCFIGQGVSGATVVDDEIADGVGGGEVEREGETGVLGGAVVGDVTFAECGDFLVEC